MPKTNFYLKDPTAKTETLIYLFFSYDGKRLKYSFNMTVKPKYWNEEDQTIRKSRTGSMVMNNRLEEIASEINQIYFLAKSQKRNLTNEYLREKLDLNLNPHGKAPKDLFFYLDEFIQVQKTDKTHRTVQKYYTLVNHLKNFSQAGKYSLTFESLDAKFYEKFHAYCLQEVKLVNNTFSKYIKTLKAFLNWATERGYNTNLNFKKFKAKERDADIIYLTEEELARVCKLDLRGNLALQGARDIFCFGCFTGLRFSDIARVKKEHIRNGEIQFISEKTTERLSIPLNDQALEILKRNNFTLPVVSIQKINEHLKTIGNLAEIDEKTTLTRFRGTEEIQETRPKFEFLTTHTARRTFITLSLEKNMRPEIVMAITGHKEYKSFKKYIKLTDKVKKVEMREVWNKEPKLKVV